MTGGFAYATSTRILKPLHERAYFYLIYATRNPKGVVKFRDVEKSVVYAQERVRATAQREHREQRTGQSEIDFPLETVSNTLSDQRSRQLEKAEARVIALLQDGPRPYETLQPLVLELPLVWKTDLNRILLKGLKHRIVIDGLRPKERVPKQGCIIRLTNPK